MNHLPVSIGLAFGACTFITAALLYKASSRSMSTLLVMSAWLLIQAIIGLSGFYTVTESIPPRFILLPGPAFLGIILLFATRSGRKHIDSLNMADLTMLHSVRIPVELVLLSLAIHRVIPELMTFEGRNFDILSGLSAPFIFYFGFRKKKLGRTWMLAWNFICLALLINIVTHAILSAPFPFQQLAFEQPNIAVLYFPYVWLPCFVVPVVLLAHLASIRQLLRNKHEQPISPNP